MFYNRNFLRAIIQIFLVIHTSSLPRTHFLSSSLLELHRYFESEVVMSCPSHRLLGLPLQLPQRAFNYHRSHSRFLHHLPSHHLQMYPWLRSCHCFGILNRYQRRPSRHLSRFSMKTRYLLNLSCCHHHQFFSFCMVLDLRSRFCFALFWDWGSF